MNSEKNLILKFLICNIKIHKQREYVVGNNFFLDSLMWFVLENYLFGNNLAESRHLSTIKTEASLGFLLTDEFFADLMNTTKPRQYNILLIVHALELK